MSLADDLLAQASLLADLDPKRPKQANLRRAVSSAYYALFHLLTDAGARLMLRGDRVGEFQPLIARAYDHGKLRTLAHRIHSQRRFIEPLNRSVTVSADLAALCGELVAAQDRRHTADYDPTARFTRSDVKAAIAQVRWAFTTWDHIKGNRDAALFLIGALINPKRG